MSNRACRTRPRGLRSRREGVIYLLLRVQVLRVAWVVHLRVSAHVSLVHVRLSSHGTGAVARALLEWRTWWAALLLELRWHVGPTLGTGHGAVARTWRAHELGLRRIWVASTAATALLLKWRTCHVDTRVADFGLHRVRRRSAFVHWQGCHVLLRDLVAHLFRVVSKNPKFRERGGIVGESLTMSLSAGNEPKASPLFCPLIDGGRPPLAAG